MINPLSILLDWFKKQWIFALGGFLAGIFTFVWQVITNPRGAINQLLINIVDVFVSVLPSTPSNLQIGTLVDNFGQSYPTVGSGLLVEIFSGLAGILAIYLLFKLYKLLPFV